MKQLVIILFLCTVCLAQWNGVKPPLGTQLDHSHSLGNPVGAWFFLENSGGVTYDLSGNNNTGTITNAVWAPGKFGPALSLDGDLDYVDIADSPVQDVGGQLTISMWAKYDAAAGTGGLLIHDNSDYKYFLYLSEANLSFLVRTPSGVSWTGYDESLKNNKWHHIVAVYDKTLSSNRLKLYGDSKLLQVGAGYAEDILAGDEGIFLGCWGANYSAQTIDNVMIFNRALTAAEVWQLYTDISCMFVQETLWLYVTAAAEEEEGQVIIIANIARWSPFVILVGIAYIFTRRKKYGKK